MNTILASPSQRPSARRQATIRPLPQALYERRPLIIAHLVFVWAAWLATSWLYPASCGPGLLLAIAAIVAELAPMRWRRFLLAEILLLVIGLLAFLWARAIDQAMDHSYLRHQAFSGWLRMGVIYWMFVPARMGMLRWMPVLMLGESVTAHHLGLFEPPPVNALQQIPGIDPHGSLIGQLVAQPAQVLWLHITIAVAACAVDAHLRTSCARRDHLQISRVHLSTSARWLVTPVLACLIIAGALGWLVQHDTWRDDIPLPEREADPGERMVGDNLRIDHRMRLGLGAWGGDDPQLVARLAIDPRMASTRAWYLRVQVLPTPLFEGRRLAWGLVNAIAEPRREHGPLHDGHPSLVGSLFVLPLLTGQSIVPVPDGCAEVGISDLLADRFGNLYRPGFGEAPRRYAVDLGADSHPANRWIYDHLRLYTTVPPELAAVLNAMPQIEQWRTMDPEHAAHSITTHLHRRCHYAATELPQEVDPRPGGDLITFLFDEDPDRRRGHCQYYASALVLLLRASGHPARCVTGLASTEQRDDEVFFRAMNAHAWAEVLIDADDGSPWWLRVDPTPASALRQPDDEDITADPAMAEAIDLDDDSPGLPLWPALIALALLVGVAACYLVQRRREQDPRIRALIRQTEDLIRFALELGITVEHHTTLSHLVRQVAQRTGYPLATHLHQHLRARYHDGPLPPSWPVAEIRAWRANNTSGNADG